MSFVGSCGCTVYDLDQLFGISIKDTEVPRRIPIVKPYNCISYIFVCKPCFDRYKKDGLILYNKQEEDAWLNSEYQPPKEDE